MGEYSSKKSLSFHVGVFRNSYLSDGQNGEFLKKLVKSLGKGSFIKSKNMMEIQSQISPMMENICIIFLDIRPFF